MTRRSSLTGSIALAATACVPIDPSPRGRLAARMRVIEAATGGTLGVALLDTANGQMIGHNRTQRFGHCSSFKLSLAALILWRDHQGIDGADRLVYWAKGDLLSVSPFTTRRLEKGATLRELAEATQKESDNTAANVLLREIGGPAALTEFWRMVGDSQSRLDRTEPELNHVPVGELRDTSTPEAMARTVQALCFGGILQDEQRALLRQWMTDTRTGTRRVRAGLPESWLAGDKTGTSLWPGMGSLYVDIGFVQPTGRAPITFATYFRAKEAHSRMNPASEAVLAEVGRVLKDFAML